MDVFAELQVAEARLAELRGAIAKLTESAGSRRRELARFGNAICLLEQRMGADVAAVIRRPRIVLRPDAILAPEIAGIVPHDSAMPEVALPGLWDLSWP